MWYIDTDNVIKLIGLQNEDTGSYVNSGTITGIFYALPALHPDAAVAVDKTGGKVGIPCTAHGQVEGDSIRLEGSLNYNADYALLAETSANELVITASYVAETFTGKEYVYVAIAGTVASPITFSYVSGSDGNWIGKIAYNKPAPVLIQGAEYMFNILEISGGEQVLAKIVDVAGFRGL